jgi:hypothetical protein
VNLVNLIDSMWNPPKFHQQVQNIFQLSAQVRPLADVLFGRKSNGNSTNYTHYANANRAANTFVDPAILADPAVYRDDEVKKRRLIVLIRENPATFQGSVLSTGRTG